LIGDLVGALVTGRLATFEIVEHSMRPTLADGDWVVARDQPDSIRPGDVVVLEHPGRPGFDLVKRVSTLGPDGVIVLGDDPGSGSVDSVAFGPVRADAIRARVLLRYRPLPPRLVR
jgi:signal peptidase I